MSWIVLLSEISFPWPAPLVRYHFPHDDNSHSNNLSVGLALAPWDVLRSGKFRTDAEEEERRKTGEKGRSLTGTWERSPDEVKVSRALEKVAGEVGTKNIRAGKWKPLNFRHSNTFLVALAYVMQKTPFVFPIIGGRKVEHFLSNLEALDISLSTEQIAFLEGILPFDVGFPNDFVVSLTLFTQTLGSQPL